MSDVDYNKLAAAMVEAQREAKRAKAKSPLTLVLDIGALIGLAVFLIVFWPAVRPTLLGWLGAVPAPAAATLPPAPSGDRWGGGAPAADAPALPQTQAEAEATSEAAYQAAIQAQPQAAPAAVPMDAPALPTAFVALPAAIPVEQVTVVPRGMPELQDTRPTLTYPTPLPAALAAPNVSADGRCVQAERNGKLYQACQDWKYTEVEAKSVADYLRTGLVPGDEVK